MNATRPRPPPNGPIFATLDIGCRHRLQALCVGLTALFIFQHIFKAKFELLDIREEMDKLRSEHL